MCCARCGRDGERGDVDLEPVHHVRRIGLEAAHRKVVSGIGRRRHTDSDRARSRARAEGIRDEDAPMRVEDDVVGEVVPPVVRIR